MLLPNIRFASLLKKLLTTVPLTDQKINFVSNGYLTFLLITWIMMMILLLSSYLSFFYVYFFDNLRLLRPKHGLLYACLRGFVPGDQTE